MHNNYYFLNRLTPVLSAKLNCNSLKQVYSQNKDELILEFDNLAIRASLVSDFPILSFPEVFSRTKRNSVNLFVAIAGKQVLSINQIKNDRSFTIQFQDEYTLLFKMHGNRSNIILFEKEEVRELFKKNQSADEKLSVNQLERPLNQTQSEFLKSHGNILKMFPTFGKVVSLYLKHIKIEEKELNKKWEILKEIITQFKTGKIYVSRIEDNVRISLINFGQVVEEFDDPIKAINFLNRLYSQEKSIRSLKSKIMVDLRRKQKQASTYILKTKTDLEKMSNVEELRQMGDLLMANMKSIKPGSEAATLHNFYTNETIIIKLKSTLSVQKNAEIFYRKAKNINIQLSKINQSIELKQKQLTQFREQMEFINLCDDLKELMNYAAKHKLLKIEKEKKRSLPYKVFEFNNYAIYVGKSAKQNDELTFKHSWKEDLWLHAKDVSGSHVIVKHKPGSNYPKKVIQRAAEIAGYYSKRKTDSLCPVIYTPRKFVRKRKGDPAGMVVVEKEKVILIEPNLSI